MRVTGWPPSFCCIIWSFFHRSHYCSFPRAFFHDIPWVKGMEGKAQIFILLRTFVAKIKGVFWLLKFSYYPVVWKCQTYCFVLLFLKLHVNQGKNYQACWNAACSGRRRWWLGQHALQPSEISLDQIPKANNFSSLEASAGPFQHLLDSKWLELSCTKAGLSYYRHLYCGCLWVCVSWKPGSFRTLLGQKGIKMARVLLNLNWCLIGFLSLFSLSPLSLWPTLTPVAVFVS